MTPIESIEICFSKIFDYKSRANRSEFWWLYLVISFLGLIVQINSGIQTLVNPANANMLLFAQLVTTLPLSLALISAGCRRLHDTGKSGWLLLLVITVIGAIPVFVWLATIGDTKENIYGKPLQK
jgi:uncharacterized membrane protein YhaH (DUF805 family)